MRIKKNEDELYRAYKESKGKDFYRLGSNKGKMGSVSSKDSQQFKQSDHDYDDQKEIDSHKEERSFTRPLFTTTKTPEDIKKAASFMNFNKSNTNTQNGNPYKQNNDAANRQVAKNEKVIQIVAFVIMFIVFVVMMIVVFSSDEHRVNDQIVIHERV